MGIKNCQQPFANIHKTTEVIDMFGKAENKNKNCLGVICVNIENINLSITTTSCFCLGYRMTFVITLIRLF